MMSFEEFAADLPLAHTQWFTSPSALEKAMEEYGICQPTRQAARGEFKAGLATRKLKDSELFSDRYSTALSLHLNSPPDAIGILLPRSPHKHFVVNGINLGWTDTPAEHDIQIKEGAPENWLELAEAESPFGRLLKAEDVARLNLYLLSEESGILTGSCIDYSQRVMGIFPPENA